VRHMGLRRTGLARRQSRPRQSTEPWLSRTRGKSLLSRTNENHPELTSYCEWYDAAGEKRVPLHFDLPARSARVWYACSGKLHWQSGDDHPSAVFTALNDKRATRIAGLIEH